MTYLESFPSYHYIFSKHSKYLLLSVFILCTRIMDVVDDFLKGRIEPSDEDTKLADVWLVDNIWAIMKEKTKRKAFENLDSLADFTNLE